MIGVKPPLKWAGGKGAHLEKIRPFIPKEISCYREPFLGGGAVFFDLVSRGCLQGEAHLSDINSELVLLYQSLQDYPEEIFKALVDHAKYHDEFYYYEIRDWDRDVEYFKQRSAVAKAARTIYLNKTGFNGLYRTNKAGYFNVPYGSRRKKSASRITSTLQELTQVSHALRLASIHCQSYTKLREEAHQGDFIYLDPPFRLEGGNKKFRGYSDVFTDEDHTDLAALFRELDQRGCHLLLSYEYDDFIVDLYQGYPILFFWANRLIKGPKGNNQKIEMLISNDTGGPNARYSY